MTKMDDACYLLNQLTNLLNQLTPPFNKPLKQMSATLYYLKVQCVRFMINDHDFMVIKYQWFGFSVISFWDGCGPCLPTKSVLFEVY